jgi:hypothetical protein
LRSQAPYAFTGKLKNVVFDLKPMVHEDQAALHEQASQARALAPDINHWLLRVLCS